MADNLMNFVHTDELLSLMGERTDEQEEFRTMHARLDEELISPTSLTGYTARAQTLKQLESSSKNDEVNDHLHDDLLDPILQAVQTEKLQTPRTSTNNSDKREKKSSIRKNRLRNPSSKPKKSVSKASEKRRRSRRQPKRQERSAIDGEKWKMLAKNLLSLMIATKRGKKESNSDQTRNITSMFRKQVCVLLVPFFKKPKEAAAFLAALEETEQFSQKSENRLTEQGETTQDDHEGTLDKGSEAGTVNESNSAQSERSSPKKPIMWSMFSIDWDSTRFERRKVARERTAMKQGLSAGGAPRENRRSASERSFHLQKSTALQKRNRTVDMRREEERRRWGLLKDELVATLLEHIRMMVTMKKLCRPKFLAKFRQEAMRLGVTESFENFVSILPVNGKVENWHVKSDEESMTDSYDVVQEFLQSNQKNASEKHSTEDKDCSSKISLSGSGSHTTFSDLSCELNELGKVIRSVIDDFEPE